MIRFLTFKSLKNRIFTSTLCIISIALSVTLFLAIERIRTGARDGFTNTISKTDLIVGAKGGQLQLLLYSIFHIGSSINNIKLDSYNNIKNNPIVEWAIPFSLGDSYKGYRVVGTDENFYNHYTYHGDKKISLAEGSMPSDTFDVAIGSEVAKKEKLKIGDSIVLSHGIEEESILKHDNAPFKIKSIIKPTQTPIDTGVYITLFGMEAMHFGWENGVPSDVQISQDKYKKENIKIDELSSFLLKLKSRVAVLRFRRDIDNYSKEPLMAIIPALALQEMWQTISYVEQILFLVSLCVLIVGVLSIIISLYTSINERRREMAILRSLGASSNHIFGLLVFESTSLVLLGCILGLMQLYALLLFVKPWLERNFSVYLEMQPISKQEWIYLGLISLSGLLAGILPAVKAYMNSLQDGLTIKY